MYLLDQLVFCQWDIVFVGYSFYSLECFTTMPFVTYRQAILRLFKQDWKKDNMFNLLSFSVPDMQIKTTQVESQKNK